MTTSSQTLSTHFKGGKPVIDRTFVRREPRDDVRLLALAEQHRLQVVYIE